MLFSGNNGGIEYSTSMEFGKERKTKVKSFNLLELIEIKEMFSFINGIGNGTLISHNIKLSTELFFDAFEEYEIKEMYQGGEWYYAKFQGVDFASFEIPGLE